MKKLVAISIIAVFMMAIAGAAMAAGTATNWTILMRGSSTTNTFYGGTDQFGTKGTAVDGKGTEDTKYTANTGNQVSVVSYEPTFPDTPPYYSADFKAPVTGSNTLEWTLLMWVGTGYTLDVARLNLWSTSGLTPPASLGYMFYVEVVRDPTGTFAPGFQKMFPAETLGSSTAPLVFMDFNNIQNTLKIADATAVDLGVKLKLVATPIPEPSSVAALATGLVGLVGFAIRRKK